MNVIPALRPELTAPPPGLPALVACDWLEERGATLGEVLWGWAGGTVGQEMLAEWLRRTGDKRHPAVANDHQNALPINLPAGRRLASWMVANDARSERLVPCVVRLEVWQNDEWLVLSQASIASSSYAFFDGDHAMPEGPYRLFFSPTDAAATDITANAYAIGQPYLYWMGEWDGKGCEKVLRQRVLSLFSEVEVTIDVAGAPRIIDAPQFLREVNGMYVRLPPG